MRVTPRLAGKRIAVLAADGFEHGELIAPVAALKEAGAAVAIVALHGGRIRGMQGHETADLVKVDQAIDAARAHDYDALFVVGGNFGTDLLRQSAAARAFTCAMDALGKPIALLSQAPLLLASAKLAKGRVLTSWPGVRDDMVHAGAIWRDEAVVRDANWLSGRSAAAMVPFVEALIEFVAGAPAKSPMVHPADSDPQPEPAPDAPEQRLRWLATPSVGAMLSLAIMGLGVLAANRGVAAAPRKGD